MGQVPPLFGPAQPSPSSPSPWGASPHRTFPRGRPPVVRSRAAVPFAVGPVPRRTIPRGRPLRHGARPPVVRSRAAVPFVVGRVPASYGPACSPGHTRRSVPRSPPSPSPASSVQKRTYLNKKAGRCCSRCRRRRPRSALSQLPRVELNLELAPRSVHCRGGTLRVPAPFLTAARR